MSVRSPGRIITNAIRSPWVSWLSTASTMPPTPTPAGTRPRAAIEKSQVNSVFGSLEVSYKNALFLNATARNDWSSTLPSDNRSYFYPSISGSAVITDLLNVQSNVISFGKIRASWAQVGNDALPYQLLQTFRAGTSWAGSTPEFMKTPRLPTPRCGRKLRPERNWGLMSAS